MSEDELRKHISSIEYDIRYYRDVIYRMRSDDPDMDSAMEKLQSLQNKLIDVRRELNL